VSSFGHPGLVIRTAVEADLPALQQVFRAAALSNTADAPLLLARPEYLVFAGDGIAEGRTRVAAAGLAGGSRILGFVTVAVDHDGGPDLEDLAFYWAVGFVEIDEVDTELGSAPRLHLDLTQPWPPLPS
jgi:hypothetical protein